METGSVTSRFAASFSLLALVALLAVLPAVASPKPPENPADIAISVSPEAAVPGGDAQVTLRLTPIDGVKINRYPKIKLQVPASEGLVEESEVAVGNDAPPPPDQSKSNYFDEVEPLNLPLKLAPGAAAGEHEVEGKLTYFFCVPASGFCAPKRVGVKIPFSVR